MFQQIKKQTEVEFRGLIKDFQRKVDELSSKLNSIHMQMKTFHNFCFNINDLKASIETLNEFMNNTNRMYDRCEFIDELKFEYEVSNVD